MTTTIHRATVDDLDALVPLFDSYRQFYAQPSDPGAAYAFLSARMHRDESMVLLARVETGAVVGFTQLYPTFSSVRTARVWVLNDLYVDTAARGCGAARALLQAAAQFARDDGAIRLELETTPDNTHAQALYHATGWQLYDDTLRFHLPLTRG